MFQGLNPHIKLLDVLITEILRICDYLTIPYLSIIIALSSLSTAYLFRLSSICFSFKCHLETDSAWFINFRRFYEVFFNLLVLTVNFSNIGSHSPFGLLMLTPDFHDVEDTVTEGSGTILMSSALVCVLLLRFMFGIVPLNDSEYG